MNKSALFTILIFINILALISYVQSSDLVTNLPSDYPFRGRMYSGYLNLDNPKKKLHYFFIESANDPKTAPLILWLNGGPGCSSLLGWAQEHGPAIFGEESDTFALNPHSWHKLANIIYLESPAGVGFSYIDSNKEEDLLIDDRISGLENLQAVIDFFRKYPSFRTNDFYIAGESYAGIYVPYLAHNIVEYNKNQVSSKQINLKGFMVGNGVTDWNVDTSPALIDFAYSHALYSPELRADYMKFCVKNKDDDACAKVFDKIELAVSSVNVYDVYRKCYKNSNNNSKFGMFRYTPWLVQDKVRNYISRRPQNFLEFLNDEEEEYNKYSQIILKLTPPCVDSKGPDEFFNRADVKAAFNVRSDLKWEMCNDAIGERYQRSKEASFFLYPKLIDSKLKILIFSGDTDAAVPVNGTQKWISNLNLEVKSKWRSWRVDQNSPVAGYRTVYEGLTFVSVMGTGHMVPQWKPKEAFYMVEKFLKNQDL